MDRKWEIGIRDKNRSEFEIYRQLKRQQTWNYKHKYDNRLFFSIRYKNPNMNVYSVENELFSNRVNEGSYTSNVYMSNNKWRRRFELLYHYNYMGTNKYGTKKMFKLQRFNEKRREYFVLLFCFMGFSSAYLTAAFIRRKQDHDIWIENYGDYTPRYQQIGMYHVRSFIRSIRYWVHYYRLVSSYEFSKYDYLTTESNTGYESAAQLEGMVRRRLYKDRRDDTFDFMQIGEDDYWEFNDQLIP